MHQAGKVLVDLFHNHIYLCMCYFFNPCTEICVTFLFGYEGGKGAGPQSSACRRYSWISPEPAITQQSLSRCQRASSSPINIAGDSPHAVLIKRYKGSKMQPIKPLMKENETLLRPDHVNQQIDERSLTQRCHRSPAGPPQLEVRKHLRCTNDCKACAHPSCIRTTAEAATGRKDGHSFVTRVFMLLL